MNICRCIVSVFRWCIILLVGCAVFDVSLTIFSYFSSLKKINLLGEKLQICGKENIPNLYYFQRNIGKQKIIIYVRTSTVFFIVEDSQGNLHIGHYFRTCHLLEKYMEVPFISIEDFDETSRCKDIIDSQETRKAMRQLENLPRYPLSSKGIIRLLLQTLDFEYKI